MPKRVAIYNLTIGGSVGGAEKRTLVMAERLARKYKVTLIVDGSHPISDLVTFFGVDLTGVELLPLHLPIQSRLRRLTSPHGGALVGARRIHALLLDLRLALERSYRSEERR